MPANTNTVCWPMCSMAKGAIDLMRKRADAKKATHMDNQATVSEGMTHKLYIHRSRERERERKKERERER